MNTTPSETQINNPEELIHIAQKEINAQIAKHQIEILKLLPRLERIGGAVDLQQMILAILSDFKVPQPLSSLSGVLSDHASLNEARKKLIEKGLITEFVDKNRKMLSLKGQLN